MKAKVTEVETRRDVIEDLIRENTKIFTKEQIQVLLKEKGFDVSESTISNDLKERRIIKDHKRGYTSIHTEEHNVTYKMLADVIKEKDIFYSSPTTAIINYDRNVASAAEVTNLIMRNLEVAKVNPKRIAIFESLNGNLVIISENEYKINRLLIDGDDLRKKQKRDDALKAAQAKENQL